MQTAVRKRAADFDFWGDTPTPEFCENLHERGPRSPAGTAQGFDPPLGAHRSAAGGAGKMEDFKTLFTLPGVDAGLAASIFHFGEVDIGNLKRYLTENGVPVRL